MKSKCVNGVEWGLPPCPECGGHPVRIWMPKSQARSAKGMARKVYLHCACGASTTEWHETLGAAREAYARKEWATAHSQRPRHRA